MKICNGCGGIIGRDCFNPIECEQIAVSQMYEQQSESQNSNAQDIYNLQQYVSTLEERILFLESITKHLRPI